MCASASTGYGGDLDFHLVDRESRMPLEVEGKLALNWRPVTGQKWESKLENCSPNFPTLVSLVWVCSANWLVLVIVIYSKLTWGRSFWVWMPYSPWNGRTSWICHYTLDCGVLNVGYFPSAGTAIWLLKKWSSNLQVICQVMTKLELVPLLAVQRCLYGLVYMGLCTSNLAHWLLHGERKLLPRDWPRKCVEV